MNGAAHIVTTEDALERAAGHHEVDAAFHVGIPCTTIDILHVVYATQYQRHITILLGLVTGTIDFLDVAHGTEVVACGFVSGRVWHEDRCTLAHITLGITTTEDVVGMTAHKLRHSLTRTVACSAIVIGAHISTRIGEGGSALTITTTKHVVDDVRTDNGDIGCRHGSCVATAIDIFDTGQITTLDDYLGIILSIIQRCLRCRIGRDIVSLITTTIDSSHVVGRTTVARSFSRLRTIHRPFHMHLHVSLWCTIQVIGTENLAGERC